MTKKRKTQEKKKFVPGSCALCKKCKIIAEGEHKGECIYGGKYSSYLRVDFWDNPIENVDINDVATPLESNK